MKRFICAVLAMMVGFGVFAGCAGGSEKETESAAIVTSEPGGIASEEPSPKTSERPVAIQFSEIFQFSTEPIYFGMSMEEIKAIMGEPIEISTWGTEEKNEGLFYDCIVGEHKVELSFWFYEYQGKCKATDFGLSTITYSVKGTEAYCKEFLGYVQPGVEVFFGTMQEQKEVGSSIWSIWNNEKEGEPKVELILDYGGYNTFTDENGAKQKEYKAMMRFGTKKDLKYLGILEDAKGMEQEEK